MTPPTSSREPFRWRLFIDESGMFDVPSDEVVCVGLLARRDTDGSSPAEIRASLRRAVPEIPWPLHAAHYNRAVLLPLAAVASGSARDAGESGREAERIVAQLRAAAPRAMTTALDRLAQRQKVPYAALKELDRALFRLDPSTHRRLSGRVGELRVLIRRLISAMSRSGPSRSDDAAWIVASGERQQACESSSAGTKQYASDRYDALLSSLFRRLLQILDRQPGPHHVFVQVLTRYTIDRQLAAEIPLHNRHVARLLAAIPSHTGAVRIVQELVPVYDAAVHPALVLTDYVASATRPLLAGPGMRLAAIESAMSGRFGAVPRSGHPPRTHIESIDAARSTAAAPWKRWAIEADAEWAAS